MGDTWESLEEARSPVAAPTSQSARSQPTEEKPRGSGHSRLRKDLANLDKAASRWLRQERDGRMNLGDLVDRIRASPAAKQLRAVHGSSFQEEEFVQGVLGRAAAIAS